ncbi:MAG: hypothetical protein K6G08_01660 [Prevotella sp.]|nr:hypothetical protein [Prevotella sp.]
MKNEKKEDFEVGVFNVQTDEKTESKNVKSVPRRVRGTLTIKAGDDMEFRAERSTGMSSQSLLRKHGQSKLYDTMGEKHKSRIAHIVIDSEATDPVAALYDELDNLTAGQETERKQRPSKRGRLLLNDHDLSVTVHKNDHLVSIGMSIDVQKNPNYNHYLMNLMQRISQCFVINQIFLNQLR